MADIEDLDVSSVNPAPRSKQTLVLPKRIKATGEKAAGDSFIPGTQTVYIRTWGCSHNNSDDLELTMYTGEYMAGLLSAQGYKITHEKDQGDLWILNSCTVKTPSEDTFNNDIRDAQSRNIPVVLSGCVPQASPRSSMTKGCSIIGTHQIDRVVEVVEETFQGRVVRLLGQKKAQGKKLGGASLDLPKIRKNPLIEIIPINTGCLNQCTYCKTKHARGDLGSYPVAEIVDRVKRVIAEGVVEIWLTSEDTGAYGRDIGTSIPELLRAILKELPDGVMLRLGMTNPPYILEHLDAIAECLNHPRAYAFIHVPIQSGSDAVLYAMRREYNRDDFMRVCDVLYANVEGLTIATDIIAGFPGETDEDFEDTFDIVRKYKFPSLFINQFYPRPGTPAANMERVPPKLVKQRTKALSDYFRSYMPYTAQKGQVQRVLVTDTASDGVHYVAHNKSFDQVLVPANEDIMGKMIHVRITSTGKFFLMGEPVADPKQQQIVDKVKSIPSSSAASNDQSTQAQLRRQSSSIAIAIIVLILSILLAYVKIA
eukprot:TRINITY_DN9395_c0_g1_i1.p1 TRINITY_DN9395_c0_g1~~TRINITY_DN9395_c0_g1_i1.p1  ORF type:complete len:539 (+),score=110.99 TRINITY_DN9395_c0_g1_i1:2-1618(+)